MTAKRIVVTAGTETRAKQALEYAKERYSGMVIISDGKAGGRDDHDAVFYLASADRQDLPGIEKWIGNPHLRVALSMDDLSAEISFFLGIPKPLEIERKFLIGYPDIKMLEDDPYCRRVEISQTYLEDEEGSYRVRKRGEGGNYRYYLTRKKKLGGITRSEMEEQITEEEYTGHLRRGNKPLKTITKDRYCLLYKNKYFEIDVFPFWSDRALMEIELKSEDEKAEHPPQITVIRDVSSEKEYTNKAIAEKLAGKQ